MRPRNKQGRFVAANCPDPNCGGSLTYAPRRYDESLWLQHFWHCDGLTHATDNGPLTACDWEVVGPFVPMKESH